MEFGRTAPAVTSRQRRLVALLSAGALILPLAACSSDDGSATTPTAQDVQTSPLLGMLGLAGSEFQEFETRLISTYEQGLSTCLTSAGFEHTVEPALQANLVEDKDEYLGTAQTNGYGVITQTEGLTFHEDDPQMRFPLYPITEEASTANLKAHEEANAANEAYQDSLSEDEYEAYQAARYGVFSEDDFDVDEDGNISTVAPESDEAATSCEEQFAHYLNDPAVEVLESEEFQELNDQLLAFYENVNSTDAIAAAYQPWSTCIADATGETVESPAQLAGRINEEFEKLLVDAGVFNEEDDEDALDEYLLEQEENDYEIDLDDLDEEDAEELDLGEDVELDEEFGDGTELEEESDESGEELEFDEGFEDGEELDFGEISDEEFDAASYAEELGVDPDALTALLERETALAVADVECRFAGGHFESVREAQAELEEQFIAENKEQLEALAEAIRTAREAV